MAISINRSRFEPWRTFFRHGWGKHGATILTNEPTSGASLRCASVGSLGSFRHSELMENQNAYGNYNSVLSGGTPRIASQQTNKTSKNIWWNCSNPGPAWDNTWWEVYPSSIALHSWEAHWSCPNRWRPGIRWVQKLKVEAFGAGSFQKSGLVYWTTPQLKEVETEVIKPTSIAFSFRGKKQQKASPQSGRGLELHFQFGHTNTGTNWYQNDKPSPIWGLLGVWLMTQGRYLHPISFSDVQLHQFS